MAQQETHPGISVEELLDRAADLGRKLEPLAEWLEDLADCIQQFFRDPCGHAGLAVSRDRLRIVPEGWRDSRRMPPPSCPPRGFRSSDPISADGKSSPNTGTAHGRETSPGLAHPRNSARRPNRSPASRRSAPICSRWLCRLLSQSSPAPRLTATPARPCARWPCAMLAPRALPSNDPYFRDSRRAGKGYPFNYNQDSAVIHGTLMTHCEAHVPLPQTSVTAAVPF